MLGQKAKRLNVRMAAIVCNLSAVPMEFSEGFPG